MAKKKKGYYVRPDGIHEVIRIIDGKRVPFRGRTDKEVDQKILAYMLEKDKGRKFPEIADEWAEIHFPHLSESARRVYSYPLEQIKKAFPGYASDIGPHQVSAYIDNFAKQGYSSNTVQIELYVCKMIFAYAVNKDIQVSPAMMVKKPRGLKAKKRNALTEEQEAAVKAVGLAQECRGWLFGYLLLYTGMRRGEALALSYSDIDRRNGVIHVRKKLSYVNGQRPKMESHLKSENGLRDIPLLQPLADVLPRDRIGLLFPGEDGGFMKASEVTTMWKHFCRAAGLNEFLPDDDGSLIETFPITPHCFRHSFATICYEAGLDSRQTAELLGDTPQTTETVYVHLRAGQRRSGADKLAAYFDRDMALDMRVKME